MTILSLLLCTLFSLFPVVAHATPATTGLPALCDAVASLGLSLAARSGELTRTDALDTLRQVDPDYARFETFYLRLVTFVYERVHLSREALYMLTWDQCMTDYAPAPPRGRSR